MSPEPRLHLERARQSLVAAELLLNHKLYPESVGRPYYAVFHAATAVLSSKDIERKSHHALIAAFGEFVIKPDLLDARYHEILRAAFHARSVGDYEIDVTVDEATARRAIAEARDFVEACTQLVGKS